MGLMAGFFLSVPASVIAQGANMSAWTQPQVVMSLVGVFLSIGAAWQMVSEDRRRIAALEANMVGREAFTETMKRIDGHLNQLTEWMTDDRKARRFDA